MSILWSPLAKRCKLYKILGLMHTLSPLLSHPLALEVLFGMHECKVGKFMWSSSSKVSDLHFGAMSLNIKCLTVNPSL